MATPNYRIVLESYTWNLLHNEELLPFTRIAEADPKIRVDPNTRTYEIDYSYGDLNNVHRRFKTVIGGNRANWAERYGTDQFKIEEETRIENARNALRTIPNPDNDPNDGHNLDAEQPSGQALTNVLQTNDAAGICLSHSHSQAAAYQFLADITDQPANFGMAGGMLFVEELPALFQDEVTAYLATNPDPPWSTQIQNFFDQIAIDRNLAGRTRLEAILARAKANNMLVFGIDSGELTPPVSQLDPSFGEMRCANMNAFAKEVMDQAIASNQGRKFVAFCGSAHSNTSEGGIPGLAQMFNIPAVKLDDNGTVKRHDEDRTLRGMPDLSVQLFMDHYLKILSSTPSPDQPTPADLRAFALQEGQRLHQQGDLPDFAALANVGNPQQRAQQRRDMIDQLELTVGNLPSTGRWRPYPPVVVANTPNVFVQFLVGLCRFCG